MKFIQNIIDNIRGKNFNIFRCLFTYMHYLNNIRHINIPKFEIIFKFDDLANYDKKVRKLDNFIKEENLKVCWGIIGKYLENPSQEYIEFIKKNNNKNYQFFNHGYYHLSNSEYEFFDKSEDEQETYIRKTQNIVFKKTGIILNIFGAPCNHIDEHTKLALEKIPEIKYWFYGIDDFNGCNIKRVIDMELGVGNPNFRYFTEQLQLLNSDKKILVIQGHPYMWNYEQWFNFKLIVLYLKQAGCKFIFPNDIRRVE